MTLLLAVLSHPVAVILLGGPAIWLCTTYCRPRYLRQAWSHAGFRWATLAAAVLVALLAYRLVPLLRGWVTMHDTHPGMGQFLLGPKWANGPKQMVLMLAFLESVTLPIAIAAAAGVYLLWRQRDRTLGLYLTSLAVFQLAFIALVSHADPGVDLLSRARGAGVLPGGRRVLRSRRCGGLGCAHPLAACRPLLAVAFLTAGLPTLVSQYRNGRRYDFRGVAQWLTPQLSAADVVYSDQPMVLAHYLKGVSVQKLRQDPSGLRDSLAGLQRAGDSGTLWIVAPAPAHAFRTNLKAGGLADWLYGNCQLRNTVGRGRLDFRQQYLQVFRCPPETASARVADVRPPSGRRRDLDRAALPRQHLAVDLLPPIRHARQPVVRADVLPAALAHRPALGLGQRPSLRMAAASAASSRGGTRRPVCSWTTTSWLPPTVVATIGRPAAAASSSTIGMPSHADDIT